eukprot:1000417_1
MATTLLLLIVSLFQHINAQTIICSYNIPCSCPLKDKYIGQPCTLQCIEEDLCKGKTLACRPGDPCTIICHAKNSCSAGTKISGTDSLDVMVSCQGDSACKDNIDISCGTGNCKLQCNNSTSCENFGSIDVTNAKSFICIGNYCPLNLPKQFSLNPTISPSSKLPTTAT